MPAIVSAYDGATCGALALLKSFQVESTCCSCFSSRAGRASFGTGSSVQLGTALGVGISAQLASQSLNADSKSFADMYACARSQRHLARATAASTELHSAALPCFVSSAVIAATVRLGFPRSVRWSLNESTKVEMKLADGRWRIGSSSLRSALLCATSLSTLSAPVTATSLVNPERSEAAVRSRRAPSSLPCFSRAIARRQSALT
mmetsp:Transcript_34763/g.76470  ORF Transcript_34763/g.76470 Transcript_34763/m.76470 type:complete len:205 (+) Transcript_34763:1180-1794(+)